MSVFGAGVAAGVAQSNLQAQQVNRQQKRQESESAQDARRARELVDTHLQALDEGEQNESPTQLRIDGQVPEHERQGDTGGGSHSHTPHGEATDEAADLSPQSPADGAIDTDADADDHTGEQLYHHVDVTA